MISTFEYKWPPGPMHMARHAQSLYSSMPDRKIGKIFRSCGIGCKKPPKYDQFWLTSDFCRPTLIFAIHVSFIIPLPKMWILLTKLNELCRNLWPQLQFCYRGPIEKLTYRSTTYTGDQWPLCHVATTSWLTWTSLILSGVKTKSVSAIDYIAWNWFWLP